MDPSSLVLENSPLGAPREAWVPPRPACILPGECHPGMTSICKHAGAQGAMNAPWQAKTYSRNKNQQDLPTSHPTELMLWVPSLSSRRWSTHQEGASGVSPSVSHSSGSPGPGPGPRVWRGVLSVSATCEGTAAGRPCPCAMESHRRRCGQLCSSPDQIWTPLSLLPYVQCASQAHFLTVGRRQVLPG